MIFPSSTPRILGRLMAACAVMSATVAPALCAQPLEALWYTRNGAPSTPAFIAHASRISVVSPQVFAFDADGGIRGTLDSTVVRVAREQRVKIVPLIMNPGFDQALMHRLLTVAAPRLRAIRGMAALCRDLKLDGLQFDVENVNVSDRDVFTAFVRESVDSIHRAGCQVSAAVVPRANDERGPTSYHTWIYDNWRGVYDYKALADTLDFLSYMTYAQHTGGSPAGPVGGYPWMKASLEYVLKLGVPPQKISLGIPGYSDHWFPMWNAREGARMTGSDISYAEGQALLRKHGATAQWDPVQKSPFAMWENNGVFEHLWLEDARAFEAKLQLVRQFKLRGYSVWLLGLEDPSTWTLNHAVRK
jgi:spore germination protein YaaH